MTDPHWQRVRELFEEVVDLDPEERAAHLDRACGDDPALRAEVEELLAHGDGAPTEFIAPPPPSTRSTGTRTSFRGRKLGEFLLQSELGRGSMGVVYLALQESLERMVAVKVLAIHPGTPESARERFHREARSVARLDHPGIARVLVDGTEDDVHWFAMELVRGHSLHVEIDRLRFPRDEAPPLLPPEGHPEHMAALARLVAEAAEALEHAHRHAVVHRDIKPSNLLLDREGHVKLADFGIARDESLGALQLTRSDELVGSLPYMSPEQARVLRMRVDHRTDVYSLGVVLYELLTLERPFGGTTSFEVVDEIRAHDPVPIRRRNPRVPRDLVVICEKAMSKTPSARFESAGEMAEDLHRFLRHEAILSRPPGPFERLGRRARRHRVALAIALVGLVALIAGGGYAGQRTRRAELEARLVPLRELLAIQDAGERTPAQWIGDRREVQVLAGRGDLRSKDRQLLERVEERFAEIDGEWRRSAQDQLRSGLARVAQDSLDIEGYDEVLAGMRHLQDASRLFPDRPVSLGQEVFQPRVSVVVRDEAGRAVQGEVGWRQLDPITAAAGDYEPAGPLPLASATFPTGALRVCLKLEGHGFRELTRFLGPGDRLELEVEVREEQQRREGMVVIPAGTLRLEDGTSMSPLNGRVVPLRTFEIDQTEVSIRSYRRFLEQNPSVETPWYFDQIPPNTEKEEWPVVYVSWENARSFAEWAGKRLPNHAEWTLAARGEDGLLVPRTEDGSAYQAVAGAPRVIGPVADIFESYMEYVVSVRSEQAVSWPHGLHHMLGNVAEWSESHVSSSTPGSRPDYESRYALGGSWSTPGHHDLSAIQAWGTGARYRAMRHGFRCARSLDED